MTTSTQTRRTGLALNLRVISYLLRIVLLLVALGVTIAVFNGDGYVALALAISAGALFATGIAPGLIPAVVHAAAQTPFLLGFLIPLWALVEAFLSGSAALPDAVRTLALYGGAVLILFTLPRYMRGPFLSWLPDGAIPDKSQKPARERRPRQKKDRRRSRKADQPVRASTRSAKAFISPDDAFPLPSATDDPSPTQKASTRRPRIGLPKLRPSKAGRGKSTPTGTD